LNRSETEWLQRVESASSQAREANAQETDTCGDRWSLHTGRRHKLCPMPALAEERS